MPDLALVTGASSGIGLELARLHAEAGGDLIVTARREEELQKLKSELEAAHGITAHVIALDLGAEGGADELYSRVTEAGLAPDTLINNAGFGGAGQVIERETGSDLAMVDLNIKALLTLCHRYGRDMAARGRGRILNVGSTAGFLPGPGQATYFATKAFVNSFSQALAHELKDRGVTVTVLAPGYVETGFADRADMRGTMMVKRGGASPRKVAEVGYEAMRKGRLLAIDDPMLSFALNWIVPLVPRRVLLALSAKTQSKG